MTDTSAEAPWVRRFGEVLDGLYGRSRTRQVTQAEIGTALGVSAQAVGAWLRGESKPSTETLAILCARYDVSPLWLLLGEGPRELSDLRGAVAGARAAAALEQDREAEDAAAAERAKTVRRARPREA